MTHQQVGMTYLLNYKTMKFREKQIQELEEAVVLKAFDNRQMPAKISPAEQAETGRIFTGQGVDGFLDNMSEEDKKRLSFVITEKTVVTLTNGKIFNPNNIADKENWRWIQLNPYISLTREAGKSSRSALFYVENRKAEAAKRVTLNKSRDKARYIIQFDTSHEQQIKIARTIGHPSPEAFSPMELTDYLLTQCDTISAAIIEAADPKNAEASAITTTFHELVRFKIISKEKGGVYRFGGPDGAFVGHTEGKVAEYLASKKNQETVAAILAQLEEKKAEVGITN